MPISRQKGVNMKIRPRFQHMAYIEVPEIIPQITVNSWTGKVTVYKSESPRIVSD